MSVAHSAGDQHPGRVGRDGELHLALHHFELVAVEGIGEAAGRAGGLPQGPQPIPTLHLCRCGSKKVVRLLVRLEESEVAFDPILYRFANLLANFFFVLTVYLKQRWQVPEVPYVSINY